GAASAHRPCLSAVPTCSSATTGWRWCAPPSSGRASDRQPNRSGLLQRARDVVADAVERFGGRPDLGGDLVDRGAAALETLDHRLAHLRLGLGKGEGRE